MDPMCSLLGRPVACLYQPFSRKVGHPRASVCGAFQTLQPQKFPSKHTTHTRPTRNNTNDNDKNNQPSTRHLRNDSIVGGGSGPARRRRHRSKRKGGCGIAASARAGAASQQAQGRLRHRSKRKGRGGIAASARAAASQHAQGRLRHRSIRSARAAAASQCSSMVVVERSLHGGDGIKASCWCGGVEAGSAAAAVCLRRLWR